MRKSRQKKTARLKKKVRIKFYFILKIKARQSLIIDDLNNSIHREKDLLYKDLSRLTLVQKL